MRPPCETFISQVLPALRALISHHLIQNHGFTQNQVARALGVTQASVSRGINQLKRFEKYYSPSVHQAAQTFAQQLAQEKLAPQEGISSLCSFCQSQKIGGLICRLHREDNPSLIDCDICGEGVTPDQRIQVLRNLARGVKLLEDTTHFAQMIPQVQSQLVMSIPDAQNIDDIAGFPSRIGLHYQRAYSFTRPEFGASKHLAKILLLMQQYNSRQQSAIVFKYLKGLEDVLEQVGLAYARIVRKSIRQRQDTDEALLASIQDLLSKQQSVDVLIDTGLVGIEPVAYLFALDAEQAANQAISLSKLLVTIQ